MSYSALAVTAVVAVLVVDLAVYRTRMVTRPVFWVAYAIILASLGFFIAVVHRIKSLWVAQCLGQIFIILGSQLTCYYYSFMILSTPAAHRIWNGSTAIDHWFPYMTTINSGPMAASGRRSSRRSRRLSRRSHPRRSRRPTSTRSPATRPRAP